MYIYDTSRLRVEVTKILEQILNQKLIVTQSVKAKCDYSIYYSIVYLRQIITDKKQHITRNKTGNCCQ